MKIFRTLLFVAFGLLSVEVIYAQDVGSSESQSVQEREIELIVPERVDYSQLAFYPDRWREAGLGFEMSAWPGQKIVFLTETSDYDAQEMSAFVKRLDAAWEVYESVTGTSPRQFKHINDKATICAIPKPGLSCGYGCGFVGATGIEASAFYRNDWPEFQKHPERFHHYYFYEMGRNFFVFGDRHSLFTTGYAVFMRYICMDRLNCTDPDARTRRTIEECEVIYAHSKLGFYEAFTNFGSGEKSNRLKNSEGVVVSPSDQPVMYATAMMKLREDYGGDEWVAKFYQNLLETRPYAAADLDSAQPQCFNWFVCASAAANQDLTGLFADRWRLPLSDGQRRLMAETNWGDPELRVSDVVDGLLNDGLERGEPRDDSGGRNASNGKR